MAANSNRTGTLRNKKQKIDLSDTTAKENGSQQGTHYQYSTLEEVLRMYQAENVKTMVSVYGVIVEYSASNHQLTIKDDTTDKFTLTLNPIERLPAGSTDEPRELKLLPGDIIRIHRLTLSSDGTRRCPRIHNVVTFDSFNTRRFCPTYLSRNPTFESSDPDRVEELIKWNVEQLLRPQVKQVPGKGFAIVDAAFAVLSVEKMKEDRVILICMNGRPIAEYPCAKLFTKAHVLQMWRELKRGPGAFSIFISNYMDEDFIQLYDKGRLFFINAYGSQGVEAVTLKPLDIIATYNLLIKPDNHIPNYYSYLLYSGSSCGRAIRKCTLDSILERKLQKQILTYSYMMQKPNFETADYDQLKLGIDLVGWYSEGDDVTDIEDEVSSEDEVFIQPPLPTPSKRSNTGKPLATLVQVNSSNVSSSASSSTGQTSAETST